MTGQSKKPWGFSECATPARPQWFAPHSLDTAVAPSAGSRERFSQPAIAVHRPSDAYSSQLFIQGLATERQSEAACLFFFYFFPLVCFF